jgi:hypothetical protein
VTVRIEVADLSLDGLDGARVDSLAVFVGPERPPLGLAAYADWRLCGALSRALRAGHFAGADGEQLLLPADGRLRAPRVFCFGVATPPADEAGFRAVAYRALDTLLRAGSRAHAAALPPVAPGGPRPALAARLWLEAALRFPPERQVILGDAHALRRDVSAARDALHATIELGAPDPSASLPPAAAPR